MVPPFASATDQVTATFDVPATTAVNFCSAPADTEADGGVIVTLTACGDAGCAELLPPPQAVRMRNGATASNAHPTEFLVSRRFVIVLCLSCAAYALQKAVQSDPFPSSLR